MRLKHKIYYIAIGVILLAVFQVGFQLRPQLAFAASHGHDADSNGHDETEGEKFKLVKSRIAKSYYDHYSIANRGFPAQVRGLDSRQWYSSWS